MDLISKVLKGRENIPVNHAVKRPMTSLNKDSIISSLDQGHVTLLPAAGMTSAPTPVELRSKFWGKDKGEP